jgi:hypothetical protein
VSGVFDYKMPLNEEARADRMTQHVNPTPLLCREHVREFLLDLAKQERPFHNFTRVSEETLIAAQGAVRTFLVNHVKRMPSKGRTL